jgi:hypothetical protein
MKYQEICNNKIDLAKLSITFKSRKSTLLKELFKTRYVIDTHLHAFDINCINKSYFIIRFLKDLAGLKSGDSENLVFSVEAAYNEVSISTKGWEKDIINILENGEPLFYNKGDATTKGIIDIFKVKRFLSFSKMSEVYKYYIENFSLGKILCFDPRNVIVTALTMDLEMGWNVKLSKPLSKQIHELKELSLGSPVLPFLYCDPRRAEIKMPNENNLFSLFNKAFCIAPSFFGVKIYPALGYDPSDYRLWPIYEVCELFSIPVITHCGGETISTDKLEIEVFEGNKKTILSAKNRKAIAYNLNDPLRWEPILKMFPNLKLSFGHFGGYETWDSSSVVNSKIDNQHRKETIIRLMNEYPHVYADFAFNFIEDKIVDNLINVLLYNNKVRERILFGTDYWVVNYQADLKTKQEHFIDSLREFSDEFDLVNNLTVENPMKFLF